MNVQPDELPNDPDLPPSLVGALAEPAECLLRLRTGELIRFTRAERRGGFVVLYAPSEPRVANLQEEMAAFPHGIGVRISDIVWCARDPSLAPVPGGRGDVPSGAAGTPPGVRIPLHVSTASDGGSTARP